MSAANRGAERKKADFYETPFSTIYALLNNYNGIKPNDLILEPSAGSGNIIKALRDFGHKNKIDAMEIREEEKQNIQFADNVFIDDFLTTNVLSKYDLIIGNPPYSLAKEFIDKSFELLKPDGKIIFLLRTNFLESQRRRDWWQDKIPSKLFVCAKRPSFTGKGTDATSYSWFIWEMNNGQLKTGSEIKIV